jgi:hypothetical protein
MNPNKSTASDFYTWHTSKFFSTLRAAAVFLLIGGGLFLSAC